MKYFRTVFALITGTCLLATAYAATARPVAAWNYEKLNREADLIVIATPINTRDLDEKTVLPGIEEIGADGQPHSVAAIGVETNFEIQTTLKGAVPALNRFFLHHLREATPPAKPVGNGPQLAAFKPDQNIRYLLFLKKDKDGHYSSVTGQTDPAIAIFPLGTYP